MKLLYPYRSYLQVLHEKNSERGAMWINTKKSVNGQFFKWPIMISPSTPPSVIRTCETGMRRSQKKGQQKKTTTGVQKSSLALKLHWHRQPCLVAGFPTISIAGRWRSCSARWMNRSWSVAWWRLSWPGAGVKAGEFLWVLDGIGWDMEF